MLLLCKVTIYVILRSEATKDLLQQILFHFVVTSLHLFITTVERMTTIRNFSFTVVRKHMMIPLERKRWTMK